MKKSKSLAVCFLMLGGVPLLSHAASTEPADPVLLGEASDSDGGRTAVYLDRLPEPEEAQEWRLHFRAGSASSSKLGLTNDYYRFSYPVGSNALALAMGWETTPLHGFGTSGVRLDLGYQSYQSEAVLKDANRSRIRLTLLPVSVGLVHLADYGGILNWLTPAVEAGAGYTFYLQTGELDGAFTKGGAWRGYASLGLRHSLKWLGLSAWQITGDYRSELAPLSSDTRLVLEGGTWMLGVAAVL